MNPEIVEVASEEIAEEGCLSLPGFYETVKRAGQVLVKAITLDGKEFSVECEGLLARAFQHEIDHLNGILLVDHLSPVKTTAISKGIYEGVDEDTLFRFLRLFCSCSSIN